MKNMIALAAAAADEGNSGLKGAAARQVDEIAVIWNSICVWFEGHLAEYALKLAVCAVILLVFWGIVRFTRAAMSKALTREGSKVPPLVVAFLVKFAGNIGWTIGVLVCLDQLGVSVGPMIAGLGVAGFIAGFACQDALGNFASGTMLVLNHPFDIGDFVQVNGFEGRVTGLTLMATKLVTGDNKQIVIPNKVVWGAPIVNHYNLGKRRVDFKVTVPYGSDLAKARDCVRAAISGVECVLKDPAPGVNVSALADNGVVVSCTPWAASDDYWTALFECQKAAGEALAKAGFGPPATRREVVEISGGRA